MTAALILTLGLSLTSRLNVGDPAPPLTYQAIKGNPISAFKPSRPAVVEFWATWCKPCIEGMPRLSQVWAQYRDRVDFVAVSVWENDYPGVAPFVREMGEKMAYPVAVDRLDGNKKGLMAKTWLESSNQTGIPVAFIIDQRRRISWIGHPGGLEPVLEKVLAGTWDAKAFKAKVEARAKEEAITQSLLKDGYTLLSTTARTHRYAEALAWIERNGSRYGTATAQEALSELKKLFSAFANSDYNLALKLAETDPQNIIIWNSFRSTLFIARLSALQALKRDEWRSVAVDTIRTGDPNLMMAVVDALAHPQSKLNKAPDIAVQIGEKLGSMDRGPLFLLRLAFAYLSDGQGKKAKAVYDEAERNLDAEKTRNPGHYENLKRQVTEAKKYFEALGVETPVPTAQRIE